MSGVLPAFPIVLSGTSRETKACPLYADGMLARASVTIATHTEFTLMANMVFESPEVS